MIRFRLIIQPVTHAASYSAKAEYPVRGGIAARSQLFWNTGSPACAGMTGDVRDAAIASPDDRHMLRHIAWRRPSRADRPPLRLPAEMTKTRALINGECGGMIECAGVHPDARNRPRPCRFSARFISQRPAPCRQVIGHPEKDEFAMPRIAKSSSSRLSSRPSCPSAWISTSGDRISRPIRRPPSATLKSTTILHQRGDRDLKPVEPGDFDLAQRPRALGIGTRSAANAVISRCVTTAAILPAGTSE